LNFRLGPFKLYDHHLSDYMRRWIFQHPFGTIRLHNIRLPDADPDLHDHPWDFVSFILRGGYVERVPCPGADPAVGPFQTLTIEAGGINFRRATDAHRIDRLIGGSAWTLVFSGRRVRSWGFWTPFGFIPWRAYVARANKGVDTDGYEARLKEVGVLE
jgi:hypothetical protein